MILKVFNLFITTVLIVIQSHIYTVPCLSQMGLDYRYFPSGQSGKNAVDENDLFVSAEFSQNNRPFNIDYYTDLRFEYEYFTLQNPDNQVNYKFHAGTASLINMIHVADIRINDRKYLFHYDVGFYYKMASDFEYYRFEDFFWGLKTGFTLVYRYGYIISLGNDYYSEYAGKRFIPYFYYSDVYYVNRFGTIYIDVNIPNEFIIGYGCHKNWMPGIDMFYRPTQYACYMITQDRREDYFESTYAQSGLQFTYSRRKFDLKLELRYLHNRNYAVYNDKTDIILWNTNLNDNRVKLEDLDQENAFGVGLSIEIEL